LQQLTRKSETKVLLKKAAMETQAQQRPKLPFEPLVA
jgi:hypothetical protein